MGPLCQPPPEPDEGMARGRGPRRGISLLEILGVRAQGDAGPMPRAQGSDPSRSVLKAIAELARRLNRIERDLARITGDQHLLSIRAAARELSVRRSKDGPLLSAIRQGDLLAVKIGNRLRVRRSDLARWMEAQAELSAPPPRQPDPGHRFLPFQSRWHPR